MLAIFQTNSFFEKNCVAGKRFSYVYPFNMLINWYSQVGNYHEFIYVPYEGDRHTNLCALNYLTVILVLYVQTIRIWAVNMVWYV